MAWLLFTVNVLLTLLAASSLVLSIAHSGYDPHTNRAPALRIAMAALTMGVSSVALWRSGSVLRTRAPERRVAGVAALTVLAGVLTFGTWVVVLASGPL